MYFWRDTGFAGTKLWLLHAGFGVIALSKAEGVWNVKHPLLDNVRRCSAEPEEAAKFFAIVLFPGAERASAFAAPRMPYLKKLRRELTDYNNCNPHKTRESTLHLAMPLTTALPFLLTLPVSFVTSSRPDLPSSNPSILPTPLTPPNPPCCCRPHLLAYAG